MQTVKMFYNGEVSDIKVPDSVGSSPSLSQIQGEVRRRILAQASSNTQINMSAAAAGGVLSDADMSAFQSALSWVSEMRSRGVELHAAGDVTFADDSHWPTLSVEATALIAAF